METMNPTENEDDWKYSSWGGLIFRAKCPKLVPGGIEFHFIERDGIGDGIESHARKYLGAELQLFERRDIGLQFPKPCFVAATRNQKPLAVRTVADTAIAFVALVNDRRREELTRPNHPKTGGSPASTGHNSICIRREDRLASFKIMRQPIRDGITGINLPNSGGMVVACRREQLAAA